MHAANLFCRKFELELIAGQAIPSKNYGELPKHFQEPVPEKKPSQGFIHRWGDNWCFRKTQFVVSSDTLL